MLKKFEPHNKTKNQNAEAHFKKIMFLQNGKRVTAIQNPYCSFIFVHVVYSFFSTDCHNVI